MGFPETRILVTKCILHIVDAFFAMFVISPLVVGYWRGMWQLLDIYLYPADKNLSIIVSTVIGLVVPFIFTVFRDCLQQQCLRSKVMFYLFSRVYTFVYAFACVNNWRSLWTLLDVYTGIQYSSIITSIATGIVCLSLIGCLRNIVSSPLFVATDSQETYFTYPTMFQISFKGGVLKSLLDSLFSVVVCGYLVVAVWRGSFHLLDAIMFPEDLTLSAWGSTVLGYSCSLVVILIQKPISMIVKHISWFPRLIILDLYSLIAFVGSVNTWRGLWTVYNIYVFPDHLTQSNITTAAAGFIILTLLGASHSVLVRGVFRDGSEQGGKSAYFYYHYFMDNMDGESKSSLTSSTGEKNEKEAYRENEVTSKLLGNNLRNDFIIIRETVV